MSAFAPLVQETAAVRHQLRPSVSNPPNFPGERAATLAIRLRAARTGWRDRRSAERRRALFGSAAAPLAGRASLTPPRKSVAASATPDKPDTDHRDTPGFHFRSIFAHRWADLRPAHRPVHESGT